jgi:hypothetical protein
VSLSGPAGALKTTSPPGFTGDLTERSNAMRNDLSKAVTDRLQASLVVRSAYRKRGAEVAAALVAIVPEHLVEGDEEPDFAAFLIVLRRTLEVVTDRLAAADLKLYAAQSSEAALRQQRDRLRRRLAEQIVGLRRLARGQWLAPDLEGLGLQALGARDPTTLLRRGELVAVRFEAENLDEMLGRPRFEAPPDLCRYVAELKQTLAALRGVVVEVNGAKCEVGKARSEKHAATADHDRIFLHAARLFEDLCRLAGKPDLAAQVRPSAAARRDGTEQEPPDADPDDVAAQGGDAPAAGDPIADRMPDRSPHRVVLIPVEQPRPGSVATRRREREVPGTPRSPPPADLGSGWHLQRGLAPSKGPEESGPPGGHHRERRALQLAAQPGRGPARLEGEVELRRRRCRGQEVELRTRSIT